MDTQKHMLPQHERSFAIVKVERQNGTKVPIVEGRYISTTPSAAAKKVYSQVIQQKLATGTLKVQVRESTAGAGNDKVYSYTVKREKLKEPVERVIKGKTIVHKYHIKIHAS